MRVRKRSAWGFARATAVAAALSTVGSCALERDDESVMCRDAFFSLVDDGHVESVNGLAIAPDYSSYYVTAWATGEGGRRARLDRWSCRSGDWAPAGSVFETSEYSDYQPVLSSDGARLYFTSTRPLAGSGPAVRQNPWMAERDSNGRWSPRPLIALASNTWDGHAVELDDGLLMFASERPGGAGMVDLYETTRDGADLRNVAELNSASSDNDMTYDPSTGVLVFARFESTSGDIDLFASRLGGNEWSPPVPLSELNTSIWESSPVIAPGGDQLLFKRGDGPLRRVSLANAIRAD